MLAFTSEPSDHFKTSFINSVTQTNYGRQCSDFFFHFSLFILRLKFELSSQEHITSLNFNIFVTTPFKIAVDHLCPSWCFSWLLLQVSLAISRRSFPHYFSFITNYNITSDVTSKIDNPFSGDNFWSGSHLLLFCFVFSSSGKEDIYDAQAREVFCHCSS